MKSLNLNFLLTGLFFAALSWYFFNNKDDLEQLLNVSLFAITAIGFLKVARICVNGMFTKVTMEAFDVKIDLKQTSYLAWVSSIGNFFGPILGGASIRALYLKKKYNFDYSRFISTLYGFYVISFGINALIGIVCLYSLRNSQSVSEGLAAPLILLSSIVFGCLLLIFIPSRIIRNNIKNIKFIPNRISNILNLMIGGWETIRSNKKLLIDLSILNFIVISLSAMETYILYMLFVDDFTIASVILYTVLGSLAMLISFTPGAIGIKEGILLFFSAAIMLDSSQILQIATVDRSISFIILFVSFGLVKVFRLDKNLANFNPK